MMKAVIMAGGKGTRISSVAQDIPKPMIKVQGKPVLEHEIECLRKQGFTDLLITVSNLGHVIMDYFGDGGKISPETGKPFDVHITYYFEQKALGNAGALFRIKDRLTDDFLLLNADLIFDIDFRRFVNFHREKSSLATLYTHPNSHPYDSALIVTDDDGRVIRWLTKEDKRPIYYKNRVNAGIHILSPKVLERSVVAEKIDLDHQILKPLAGTGKMFAYDSPEYVKDMGTPERYKEVCSDYVSGKVNAKNLHNAQKAVFIDRDGTINRYAGFLQNYKDFELLPDVPEAIKKINDSEYLAIVVTNQPVIARGEVTVQELNEIHCKMETLLGRYGAYIDAIYYCPHHPDKGFAGERIEYKIDCDCRKPKPGMLLKAAEDFNIDIYQSWIVGDGKNDILAGKSVGCKTAYISKLKENTFGADTVVSSVLEFVMKNI